MSKKISYWLQLCLMLGAATQVVATTPTGHRIEVTYHRAPQTFTVQHCFDSAPTFLRAGSRHARHNTQKIQWNGQAMNTRQGRLTLTAGVAGCLSYDINPKTSQRTKQQHPDSLLVKIADWLWLPENQSPKHLPQLQFNHGRDIKVSAPWRLISRTPTTTLYQLQPTPQYSSGYVALGPMFQQTLQLDGASLRLSIMTGSFEHKASLITEWVQTMASAVTTVSDGFPVKDAQVLVVMVDGQRGAVPWGQVNRSGGPGVLFVVNGNSGKQALFDDWTAAHEFSHLLTPYTPYDRWLSEGFASYHQNITRLRSGLLDEKTAWSKLIAGFERGRKSAAADNAPVLAEAGRRHNMQMYWGGAVIALKADVALQQQTDGVKTLSKALSELQSCCLGQGKSWSAKSLFNKLDNITDTHVFTQLYEQEVKRRSYPEYRKLLLELGINRSDYGSIRFNNLAPQAEIRHRLALSH